MVIQRREVHVFQSQLFQAASLEARAPPVDCEDADQFMLLIDIGEGGTVDHSATLTFSPLFIDDDGHEYINGNTTWGTFAIAGSAVPEKVAVNGPVLSKVMGLKVVSAGTLSTTNYFTLNARIVFMSNTGA